MKDILEELKESFPCYPERSEYKKLVNKAMIEIKTLRDNIDMKNKTQEVLGKTIDKVNAKPNYESLDRWIKTNKFKVSNKDLTLIRDWVKAEVSSTLESLNNEWGFNDHRHTEKKAADDLFDKIKSIFGEYK